MYFLTIRGSEVQNQGGSWVDLSGAPEKEIIPCLSPSASLPGGFWPSLVFLGLWMSTFM